MRESLSLMDRFLDDFETFRETNHIDNLADTVEAVQKQKREDWEIFMNPTALEKYKAEQLKTSCFVHNKNFKTKIWKPERFYLKKLQKKYPDNVIQT